MRKRVFIWNAKLREFENILNTVISVKVAEIEKILSAFSVKYDEFFDMPTAEDWQNLSDVFNAEFDIDFVTFINLMSIWNFPGEIYNITENNNNGNDTIKDVYDFEMNYSDWDKNMIPFYGIGNGDYFCINSNSKNVWYFYHDTQAFELYCDNFEEWIKELPEFVG